MYTYKTIKEPVRTKIAVGACRFYASLYPCSGEEEARAFLEQTKQDLPGATHHAYALRLGTDDALLERSGDAGEPAGTAGPPMLQVLQKADLTNLLLVGTRYFGGVKLGIGGLIRGYRACAEAGVEAAHICSREWEGSALVTIPYDDLGNVLKEIEAAGASAVDFRYDQDVSVLIRYPLREEEKINRRLAGVTRGKARVERL